MREIFNKPLLEKEDERKPYAVPGFVGLGSLSDSTLGQGTSTVWDIGSGRKKA